MNTITYKSSELLVWDAEGPLPIGDWTSVLWRRHPGAEDTDAISISQKVEQNADRLRALYLAWIYEFGQTCIDNRRVIDHLALRPGLSLWWMCSLAQQFNLAGQSGINDTLKAMALEELLVERSVEELQLYSANAALAECLTALCHKRGIAFAWSSPTVARYRPVFGRLPAVIRAFVYFSWYCFKMLPMLMQRPGAPTRGGVLFMDVLVHLDRQALAEGRFDSNYWTDLVSRLKEWNVSCLWGHIYFRHPETRTPSSAARLVKLFIRNSPTGQSHFLLEVYLRPTILLTALRDYWRVSRAARRLFTLKRPIVPNSAIDPWPLHQYEWKDSLSGREAVRNCLLVALFEAVMTSLPKQRVGVYICENQPWEVALLYAWRTSGHGKIYGIAHTTVRYWDLRYHHDPRCYESDASGLGLPLPDRLAVNGPLARESLLAGGYPQVRLFEVEALRFLHLQAQLVSRHSRPPALGLRVLVCGDFLADINARLLSWLESAAKALPSNTLYLVKPHPAYPIESQHYPSLSLQVRQEPIHCLLGECDVVFTSNITSAAVDAFCAGVPVVQMMDGHMFNMSPLRGQRGVVYVESPDGLAYALGQAKALEGPSPKLFNFDPGLALWRRLLAVGEISAE